MSKVRENVQQEFNNLEEMINLKYFSGAQKFPVRYSQDECSELSNFCQMRLPELL